MENREYHFITDMNQLGYIEKNCKKKIGSTLNNFQCGPPTLVVCLRAIQIKSNEPLNIFVDFSFSPYLFPNYPSKPTIQEKVNM